MPRILHMTVWIVIIICACGCSKKLAPRQGLVGEYLLQGDGKDNSSYHNHGEVQDAVPSKGHKGKSAKSALSLDGVNQFISIPHAVQNNFIYGQDFSISLWIAVDQPQNDVGSTLNDVLRKWKGDTQGYPFAIVYYNHTAPDSLRNRFSFAKYDGSICRNSPQMFSNAVKTGSSYTHLVVVKQGDWISMYQDEKLVARTKDTTRPEGDCGSHNNSAITVGTRNNRVRFFTGAVDDIRLYNRALTEKEIALLFRI